MTSRRFFYFLKKVLKLGVVFLYLSIIATSLSAQSAAPDYPLITSFDRRRDAVFAQYCDDVDYARKLLMAPDAGNKLATMTASLLIYRYKVQKGDEFFQIASGCNVSQSAIATLNRISSTKGIAAGDTLLLPTVSARFLPREPASALEQLLSSARTASDGASIFVTRDGRRQGYTFFPGDDFSSTERLFFLNPSFRYPLQSYRLTSTFGSRVSPITGTRSQHRGLDLAAPHGSDVYASRSGLVSRIGDDPVYGKYIIIRHDGSWSTLYGHLSQILVKNGAIVQSGALIGKVGSTGASTGPHLHFEIRENDKAIDPQRVLPGGN